MMEWGWFLLGVLVGWLIEWGIDLYFWRRHGGRHPVRGRQDNLTRIEGIGPKLATLLNEHGIYSFTELGQTPVARLEAILAQAGARYRLARPGTWAEQARFAAAGEWEKLVHLQDRLSGGRRRKRSG